jgi:citronellol/citronellal dehydrogenase
MTLKDKTVFISGGSRSIGLAIALRAARDGANIALIAKTAEPHPKLEATVFTAAQQIEQAGGRALPIVGDIRDETQVANAVADTVSQFGGIDICVNNASAINLAGTEALEIKRYDLMQAINTRGTFLVSRACIPHLKHSDNPHILTLSPPISLEPRWLAPHIGYTLAKYGMTLCALGFAAEFRQHGIASRELIFDRALRRDHVSGGGGCSAPGAWAPTAKITPSTSRYEANGEMRVEHATPIAL